MNSINFIVKKLNFVHLNIYMKLMLACLFKNLNNVISCILLDAQILNYDYKINTINFK